MSGSGLTGIAAAVLTCVLGLVCGLATLTGGWSPAPCTPDAAASARASGPERSVPGFDTEQATNASTITTVTASLGLPRRAAVIAVATAITESSLRNLRHGDTAGPDSRGLFQQRAPWGPETARTNPVQATRMFLTGGKGGQPGLTDIPHWDTLPLTRAAQAVQHSAHPTAYARHETDAETLLTALAPAAGTGFDPRACPGPCAAPATTGQASDAGRCAEAAAVFRRARSWLTAWSGGPVPYSASSNPTDRFGGYRRDCSGYVSMALGLAGPGLNTSGLAARSAPIPKTALQPGDLLINTAPDLRGHVVLFERWADSSMTRYYGYEQTGSGDTQHRIIPYPYFGDYPMTAYRFHETPEPAAGVAAEAWM